MKLAHPSIPLIQHPVHSSHLASHPSIPLKVKKQKATPSVHFIPLKVKLYPHPYLFSLWPPLPPTHSSPLLFNRCPHTRPFTPFTRSILLSPPPPFVHSKAAQPSWAMLESALLHICFPTPSSIHSDSENIVEIWGELMEELWKIDLGKNFWVPGLYVCDLNRRQNWKIERRRFDSDTGTAHPERNRGVPAGIWPEFPERTGIKTGTKTTPFCPGFMNGTERSGRNGTNFTTLLLLPIINPNYPL